MFASPVKFSLPLPATVTLTSRSLPAETTRPRCLAKAMAQTFEKKSFFLPGAGSWAPTFRLRNLAALASVWVLPLTPSMTLTKACVSPLKRSGPDGEAAMFGR